MSAKLNLKHPLCKLQCSVVDNFNNVAIISAQNTNTQPSDNCCFNCSANAGKPPPQQHQQQPPAVSQPVKDEDVAVVKDMFPDVEVEVIKSVLEANHGDKDATINNLLSMQSS